MADPKKALEVVLLHEGGFIDSPYDPGGATNYGISLRFIKENLIDLDIDMDGDIDGDDIRQMDKDTAIDIYLEYFWYRNNYGDIGSDYIAAKIFDMSVNMGPKQSHILAQRACRASGFKLKDDGILGPVTMAILNKVDEVKFLAAARSESAGFYRCLARTKPLLASFLKGWLNRAYE